MPKFTHKNNSTIGDASFAGDSARESSFLAGDDNNASAWAEAKETEKKLQVAVYVCVHVCMYVCMYWEEASGFSVVYVTYVCMYARM